MNVAARLAAAAVVALPVAGLAAAPADATFFQAETAATAVHVRLTQEPASSIVTASLFDDAAGYAASEFASGGTSEAMAAPAFPGRLVVQGPELLCSEVFSCPASPPDYPFLADASNPRQPHDTATVNGHPMGTGPFVVTPASASAHADDNGNAAQTHAAELSMLAGTPAGLSVGASRSTTSVATTGGTVRVRVSATATDVRIGSLLHLDSVAATDVVTLRPGRPAVDRPHVAVTGLSVAGRAATVDHDGVHVAGQDGPSVARRLAAHGITLRTVGVHRSTSRSGTRSDAVGLEVDLRVPVQNVPYVPNPVPTLPPPFDQVPQLPGVDANGTYVAQVTLGAVGAAAGYGRDASFDFGDVLPAAPGPTHPGGTAPPSGGTGPATGSAPAAAGGGTPHGSDVTSPAPQQPPAVAGAPTGAVGGVPDVLSAHALEMLYAVLALGSVALFAGWRGVLLLRHHAAERAGSR